MIRNVKLTITLAVIIGLLIVSSLMVNGVSADFPTRPTPNPPTTPAENSDDSFSGGFIALYTMEEDVTTHLWTQVQWQDPHTGVWTDVDGWHGHFNEAGQVLWWVAPNDLGDRPFRWQVYANETQTELIATTEPFELPTRNAETTSIMIDLP